MGAKERIRARGADLPDELPVTPAVGMNHLLFIGEPSVDLLGRFADTLEDAAGARGVVDRPP